MNRRDYCKFILASALPLSWRPGWALNSGKIFSGLYPFALGVASGAPQAQRLVLWTKLSAGLVPVLSPLPEIIDVRWELALDEGFQRIVQRGTIQAHQRFGHSIHLQLEGLTPATVYFYRFLLGDALSPVGRTMTAPAADVHLTHQRIAFASCQHYEYGYFGAYRAMLADAPDLVIFLGDYIYEKGRPSDQEKPRDARRLRSHNLPSAHTLEDYRQRYTLYKLDPALQAMHAACPWLVTWDDHEVVNDYADLVGGSPRHNFALRRAAAYQAWFEHMPVQPLDLISLFDNLRVYAQYNFGQLVNFYLLDDRQYRDPHACSQRWRGGSSIDPENCPELYINRRTLLGWSQEAWLYQSFRESRTRWNLLSQQTLFSPLQTQTLHSKTVWNDGWDGYPAARQRILDQLQASALANPVIIGGDVHANWICDVYDLAAQEQSAPSKTPIVASEFCATSITSPGMSPVQAEKLAKHNPHVRFVNTQKRGYGLLDIYPDTLHASLRVVDNVHHPEPQASTLARFVVSGGQPGWHRAS